MQSLQRWPLEKLRRMVLPFIVAAAIGFIIRLGYPEEARFSSFFHMLGDALAVGAVIALTLEFFASRLLIDDTARELSDRLVGEGLPKRLQAAISEIVHETAIVLDEVVVRYRIRAIPGDHDHVDVEIQRSYRATNYGRSDVTYNPFLAEEHFHHPTFLSLNCDSGVLGKISSLDEKHLSERVKIEPGSGVRTVSGDKVRLRPYRDDPHQATCRATWVYRLRTPASYSDVISFGRPTLDTTVIVDERPAGFGFAATEDREWTDHSGNQWVYRRAFLSKQHIRVWWSRDITEGGPSKSIPLA